MVYELNGDARARAQATLQRIDGVLFTGTALR